MPSNMKQKQVSITKIEALLDCLCAKTGASPMRVWNKFPFRSYQNTLAELEEIREFLTVLLNEA